MNLDELLDAARRIAAAAGDAILAHYAPATPGAPRARTPEPHHKHDGSPLTAADLDADRLIRERLAALPDALPLLSEEGREEPLAARRAWRRFWLVDPLDGTREFVEGNGEFTVNLALVEDGRPLLGVVHAPALALTYWAARGRGAWKRAGTGAPESIRVASRRARAEPWRVVGSRSHAGASLGPFLAAHDPHVLCSVGSALKFGFVAEGRAHVYPRFGPTMEWDTAAGQAIVEEAGGSVRAHPEGGVLRYNKPSLVNPWFVASCE
jgi:3'(2'), 5'-bisphosphate nucleotidase